MITKKIFFKKKIKPLHIVLLIILIFILCFFILFYKFDNYKKIEISSFNDDYYIIPKDPGGTKVQNLNKKSLHLSDKDLLGLEIKNISKLKYSIQFLVSTDYKDIKNFLLEINNKTEKIYKISDFHTLVFNSDIGVDYFLLYKNFDSINEAKDYCLKYLNKLDNCLVVNVEKIK